MTPLGHELPHTHHWHGSGWRRPSPSRSGEVPIEFAPENAPKEAGDTRVGRLSRSRRARCCSRRWFTSWWRRPQGSSTWHTLKNGCGHDRNLIPGRAYGRTDSDLNTTLAAQAEHESRQPRCDGWQKGWSYSLRLAYPPVVVVCSSVCDGQTANTVLWYQNPCSFYRETEVVQ